LLFSPLLERCYHHRGLGYGEVIGAKKGHFCVDIVIESLDDGNNSDYGENTDDDSQKSEKCPELV
jgi:hypothetical protein